MLLAQLSHGDCNYANHTAAAATVACRERHSPNTLDQGTSRGYWDIKTHYVSSFKDILDCFKQVEH